MSAIVGEVSTFAWTRRDQWHVTLQFYGRVADAETLAEGISAAAAASSPVQIAIRGGGAFPSPRRAHVFWLGVDGRDALRSTAAPTVAANTERQRVAKTDFRMVTNCKKILPRISGPL